MFMKRRIATLAIATTSIIGLSASAASACCQQGGHPGGSGTGSGPAAQTGYMPMAPSVQGGTAPGTPGLGGSGTANPTADPGNAPAQGVSSGGTGINPVICGNNIQVPVGGTVPVIAVPLGPTTGTNTADGNAACTQQQGAAQGQQQGADQGQGV